MINSFEALKVISRHRTNEIVVSVFTANREWNQVSANPDLDLPLGTAMGKGSSLGLGVALAQPKRKVIVLDGDGSLLMNLGSLVTIAHMAPLNLIHFVFGNGVYLTTGSQPIPVADKFSFAGVAREAGYVNVQEFDDMAIFGENIKAILQQTGPSFIYLRILPSAEKPTFPKIHTGSVVTRFRAAMGRSS